MARPYQVLGYVKCLSGGFVPDFRQECGVSATKKVIE